MQVHTLNQLPSILISVAVFCLLEFHCNLSPAEQLRKADSVAFFCLLELHCNSSPAEKLLEIELVASSSVLKWFAKT